MYKCFLSVHKTSGVVNDNINTLSDRFIYTSYFLALGLLLLLNIKLSQTLLSLSLYIHFFSKNTNLNLKPKIILWTWIVFKVWLYWLFYHVKQGTKCFKITKLYHSLAFGWDTSKSLFQCFVGRTFANLAV